MKRYNITERVRLAQLIRGIRDLSRHTDTHLAELGQVHRGNVTSFNAQKRPHALSTRTIDEFLAHYGLIYDGVDLAPTNGEHCPQISLRTEFDRENTSLSDFVKALGTLENPVYLCPIVNEPGDFALIWRLEDGSPMKGWCAVALGLGANNSALEQLLASGAVKDVATKIDDEVYRIWRDTGPRKSEVLHACARGFRARALGKRLEDGMGNVEDTSESQRPADNSIL